MGGWGGGGFQQGALQQYSYTPPRGGRSTPAAAFTPPGRLGYGTGGAFGDSGAGSSFVRQLQLYHYNGLINPKAGRTPRLVKLTLAQEDGEVSLSGDPIPSLTSLSQAGAQDLRSAANTGEEAMDRAIRESMLDAPAAGAGTSSTYPPASSSAAGSSAPPAAMAAEDDAELHEAIRLSMLEQDPPAAALAPPAPPSASATANRPGGLPPLSTTEAANLAVTVLQTAAAASMAIAGSGSAPPSGSLSGGSGGSGNGISSLLNSHASDDSLPPLLDERQMPPLQALPSFSPPPFFALPPPVNRGGDSTASLEKILRTKWPGGVMTAQPGSPPPLLE